LGNHEFKTRIILPIIKDKIIEEGMEKKRFVVMSRYAGPRFIEKLVQAGIEPVLVVSSTPFHITSQKFKNFRVLVKILGYFKFMVVKLLNLPGYDTFWVCKKYGIPVWPEETVNGPEFEARLKHLNIDYCFVFAFKILKKNIFTIPRFGTINCHPSLLPHHRGATPENWTIYNKDSFAGITFHYISEKIDGGPILEQHRIPLSEYETTPILRHHLTELGVHLFVKLIFKLMHGGVVKYDATDGLPESYDSFFDEAMGEIKTTDDLERIDRIIRSCGNEAWFIHEETRYTIIHAIEIGQGSSPGGNYPAWSDGNILIKNQANQTILLVVRKKTNQPKDWKTQIAGLLRRALS
jgi:methionyl-tRNA formyltransferase